MGFRDGAVVRVQDANLTAALKQLKRQVEQAGVLKALKRHAAASSPGERRRRKQVEAQQRARRRQQRERHDGE